MQAEDFLKGGSELGFSGVKGEVVVAGVVVTVAFSVSSGAGEDAVVVGEMVVE